MRVNEIPISPWWNRGYLVRILLMNQHLPIVEVYELPNSHKGTRDTWIIRHQALRANGFGHPTSPTGA